MENRAALSARQKLDRSRTKATYDLDPILQEACTALAKEWDTSTSQAVAICLAYALDAYSRICILPFCRLSSLVGRVRTAV